MRVQILKNCFKPEEVRSKAPTILTRDSTVELPDALAQQIIDKGYAAELTTKQATEEKPKKGKKAKDEVPSDELAA